MHTHTHTSLQPAVRLSAYAAYELTLRLCRGCGFYPIVSVDPHTHTHTHTHIHTHTHTHPYATQTHTPSHTPFYTNTTATLYMLVSIGQISVSFIKLQTSESLKVLLIQIHILYFLCENVVNCFFKQCFTVLRNTKIKRINFNPSVKKA